MSEQAPKHSNNESPSVDSPSQPSPTRVPITLPAGKPIVTYIILALTITVFILQVISDLVFNIDIPANFGMKINELIQRGQVWRLITPLFLHGSILHIGFNMYALYSIGSSLERYYGHLRFTLLYLVAGFAGNVVSFLFTASPSLGASTAIFGLAVAEGVFIYNNRALFGQRAQSMLINIGFIVLVNLALGTSAGIDNWGHLGGILGGLAYASLAGPILQVKQDMLGFRIADIRSKNQIWYSAFGVTILFALAAAVNIIMA